MNSKKVINDVLHFFTHNSFLFSAAVMCFVHAILLVLMVIAGVRPLAFFNILSVVVYLFCVMLCKAGYIMPVYISILLEVAVYSVLSVYYVGWDSSGYLFLFSIVPLIIYFGAYLFKGQKRWWILLILVLYFLLFAVMCIAHSEMEPVYQLTPTMKIVFTLYTNFVMIFAVVFYNTIYIYGSESAMVNLEQKNEKLEIDAREDALTLLLNRRGFLPEVEALMKGDGQSTFCIAFCDIDDFKDINDSYGHDCGDEVLRHLSRMFQREMSDSAICRWGGEEIVILLKDDGLGAAQQKMEFMRKLVESTPTVFFNKRISATVTIGLEEYKDFYKDPEDIIRVADERMYYGKQHGKNIVITEFIESEMDKASRG